MTKGQPTPTTTTQGVTALDAALLGRQFETRHGLLAGQPRTLWDEGEPPAPAAPAPAAPATPAAPTPPAPQSQGDEGRLLTALQGLMSQQRHAGDVNAVALTLLRENHQYREQIRNLQGTVPAEGAVVVPADQAQVWQAVQELLTNPAAVPAGLPEALRARLISGDQAVERETGRTLADVGRANASVLMDRLRATGLQADVTDVPAANGQPARQEVHLFQRNADGTRGQDLGELRAYAQQHWQDYLPSLFPQATPQGGTVINGQAGAGNGTQTPGNPLTESINRRTAAGQGQAAVVVDALSFK